MELENFNPWWRDGKVSTEFLGRRRKIFSEVIKYIDKRQIVLFTGLRRVGKTTLMYQIIDGIISKEHYLSPLTLKQSSKKRIL